MVNEKLYGSLLGVSIFINALLSLFFTGLLIWTYIQKDYLPTSVAICCLTFIGLFVLFLGAFLMLVKRKTDITAMWAVVLSIGRFLTVLIGAFALMSNDTFKQEDRDIEDDVLSWIEYRKVIVIVFCLLYFPVFLIELFALNRYHSQEVPMPDFTKSTQPLHTYEKVNNVHF